MAGDSNAHPQGSEERGEYNAVPLHDTEDAAEVKKAAATAPPPGLGSHPGTLQVYSVCSRRRYGR